MGKITEVNKVVNRKLKQVFLEQGIVTCEVRLAGCMYNNFLSFAHRHKRLWYRGQLDLLADFNQVVLACASCHNEMERNKNLTERVFERLRPNYPLSKDN